MKLLSLLAGGVTAASALSVQHVLQAAVDKTQQTLRPEKYLVELSPSDRRWVTEDEKWALRRVRPILLSEQHLTTATKFQPR